MKCSVSTAGEEHNDGVSQVFILLCAIWINLRRQVLQKKHARGFDAHVAFPTILLHSLTSVPESSIGCWDRNSCHAREYIICIEVWMGKLLPSKQFIHQCNPESPVSDIMNLSFAFTQSTQGSWAERQAAPLLPTSLLKQFTWRTFHELPWAAHSTSSLSLLLASCCVYFVCSFNIQPEFPSSVTNLPAHNISGEQIILVAADIIFQDCNKEQCGYRIFWLYPHFIVKQDGNVSANLTPFWFPSTKTVQFSLLLVTNRSQDESAIERLIIHMSSATEWWTHALSVPAHLLCLVTVLVSLHMTFASLPQLPLAASICPPPLLAHTHTEDSLREEERHQMLAQVCKPCCCSTAVL